MVFNATFNNISVASSKTFGSSNLIRGSDFWWEWPDKMGDLWWEWPGKMGDLWWEWPDKRGDLWLEWPCKRLTTVIPF